MYAGSRRWADVVLSSILLVLLGLPASLIVLRYWDHHQSPALKNSNAQEAK